MKIGEVILDLRLKLPNFVAEISRSWGINDYIDGNNDIFRNCVCEREREREREREFLGSESETVFWLWICICRDTRENEIVKCDVVKGGSE